MGQSIHIPPPPSVYLPPHPTSTAPMTSESTARNDLSKIETNASALYSNMALWKKSIVLFTTSWSTLGACFSSTSLLSAAQEVAEDLDTRVEVINLSTGGLLIAVGLSSLIWSPLAAIFGRKVIYNVCLAVLFSFTVGAALAPSMPVFVAMRILSGFQGCYFHVAGQTIIAEYFTPTQRGTATGFFLAGTVLGPPLGPLVAGIMVTYSNWRSILWLQSAMIAISFIFALFFIPSSPTDRGLFKLNLRGRSALAQFNPLPVFQCMTFPNVGFTHLSCGLLAFTQYSILSAPRHILSTQFNLTSPLITGLFYIAPASGFLLGTVVGGKYSDVTVRRWIIKRGERLPQDRLRSGMIAFFFIIPVASLIYGWSLQCIDYSSMRGGLALPIVTTFFTAMGLLTAFASLNTYCAEAIPKKRREVIAGKYMIQYCFSAFACAGSVPLVESIGIGPATTIGVAFVIIAGSLTFATSRYGLAMQNWRADARERVQTEKASILVPHAGISLPQQSQNFWTWASLP